MNRPPVSTYAKALADTWPEKSSANQCGQYSAVIQVLAL